MQFPTLLLALLASTASVLAQIDLSGLPDCAQACLAENVGQSACSPDDLACLCADTVFFTAVETCVLATCSADDIATALAWAAANCPATSTKRALLFGRKY